MKIWEWTCLSGKKGGEWNHQNLEKDQRWEIRSEKKGNRRGKREGIYPSICSNNLIILTTTEGDTLRGDIMAGEEEADILESRFSGCYNKSELVPADI